MTTYATTTPESPATTTPGRPPASLLVVTTVPVTFGFLQPYLEHFHAAGCRIGIATGAGSLAERTRRVADSVHVMPWTRRPSLREALQSARLLRKICLDGDYDIVHVHTPIAAAITRFALGTIRRSKRPAVVYTAHGFHFMPGQPWKRRVPPQVVEWLAGRVTDRLVVINDVDFESAKSLRLVRPDHLVLLPGIGLDLGWYDRTPDLDERAQRVRKDLGITDDEPLITMVAEMTLNKGHRFALQALASMTHQGVHLALAGDGALRADIEQQARDLGIASRVHLLAHVDDVRPVIAASCATTLPSGREGLNRSVLESLAIGVPVVGSDIRGISSSVRPDGGILVPAGDVEALTRAFDKIVSDPPLNATQLAALRARLSVYSVDALIHRHELLYDEVRDELARR